MSRITYISNDVLSLVEYKTCDDRALYEDWLDPETQKGYNGVYVTTFEDFQSRELRQRFFAMIQLNNSGEIIGAVGISPPETIADLAIWVFNAYRRQGYGTSAFALATKYAVEELKIPELHAGAYEDNIASQRMLKKCGYIPYPAGTAENGAEKHYITGEDIIQIDYIYLHPDYFRMGIGTKAMEFAFDIARRIGKTMMTVWVLDENLNSIKFYEKCGFAADGKIMDAEYGKVNGRMRMRRSL